MEHHIINLRENLHVHNVHARKMTNRKYGHPNEGMPDLCNGAVSEKIATIF